ALLDEATGDHALDRPVEGARAELDVATGARRDVALDGVPVAFLVGQRQEDLELRHREREQGLRVRLFLFRHYICRQCIDRRYTTRSALRPESIAKLPGLPSSTCASRSVAKIVVRHLRPPSTSSRVCWAFQGFPNLV